MKAKITIKNLDKVNQQIQAYQMHIKDKLEDFVKKLSEQGVEIATYKILEKDAVYTGELSSSMQMKPGDVITNGVSYVVFTDCPWAKYVEFGTGLVGARNQHFEASLHNWHYDINAHGEAGWYYKRDDEDTVHWTKGMPSRPFMYETAQEMYLKISEVAQEVFGS